jgi:intracellular septation protein
MQTSQNPQPKGQYVKLLIDLGAPISFAAVYFLTKDFLLATAVLIGGCVVALGAGYYYERKIAPMPLITALAAIIFGGLTLFFKDPRILKMKLTIIYGIFAAILFGGLATNRLFLKQLLASALRISDQGWRGLSVAYALFFIVIAIINEIIWRSQSEEIWVWFKASLFVVFLVFSIALTPYLLKHLLLEGEAEMKENLDDKAQ